MENKKKSVLQEAEELIHGARQQDYDHPFIDFSRTAKMLTGLLSKKLKEGVEIDPEEVALIQICVKLSRLIATPGHYDSMVDVPGYMGTYEMVMDRKAELESKEQHSDGPVLYTLKQIGSAIDEAIAKKMERERYHQNLRAMRLNPEETAEGFKIVEDDGGRPKKPDLGYYNDDPV